MPANSKVSVAWQIVFTFLPIVNFWAFYRIRKLRKYVLYVILPEIILGTAYGVYIAMSVLSEPDFMRFARVDTSYLYYGPHYVALNAIGWALQGLSIYLVIVWSRRQQIMLFIRRNDGALTGIASAVSITTIFLTNGHTLIQVLGRYELYPVFALAPLAIVSRRIRLWRMQKKKINID